MPGLAPGNPDFLKLAAESVVDRVTAAALDQEDERVHSDQQRIFEPALRPQKNAAPLLMGRLRLTAKQRHEHRSERSYSFAPQLS
jgi:hypothetical protein